MEPYENTSREMIVRGHDSLRESERYIDEQISSYPYALMVRTDSGLAGMRTQIQAKPLEEFPGQLAIPLNWPTL